MSQRKRKNQAGEISVVRNQITQLPDYTEKQKVLRKNGSRIVSTTYNNLFPQILNKIVNESSTLKAVINSIAEYVSYGSVIATDAFLSKINEDLNKYYGWDEFVNRLAKDYKGYGYAFIEEVRVGSESFAYHLDASRVRFMEYDGDKPEMVAISKDWNDSKIKPTECALYPNYTEDDGKLRRVIPIMDYMSGNQDYPLPSWSGAFYDAQVETFIPQYNANQFENGITLSAILMMDAGDVTTEAELLKFKRKIERELQGTSNGRSGKTLIVPKSGDVQPPEYVTYPMEKEGSFMELQKMVENNIIKACSWFRSLAGLESAGSLGNNQQMRNEWEQAEKMINNIQHKIMDAYLLTLENTTFKDTEYTFNNQSPMNLSNDITAISDLLQNKDVIGVGAVQTLLEMLGLDTEQAQKLVSNDSE